MPEPTVKLPEKEPASAPSTAVRKKPRGTIIRADEKLIHRKPQNERSGGEHEAAAMEVFNDAKTAEYEAAIADAKRRGINPNMVPKPASYTVNDILASVLKPNEIDGLQVGIVLNDSKKFYYKP